MLSGFRVPSYARQKRLYGFQGLSSFVSWLDKLKACIEQ